MERQEEERRTLGGVWWQEGNIVQLLDGALGCTGIDKVSRCFMILDMTDGIAQVASQAASNQIQQIHQLGSIKSCFVSRCSPAWGSIEELKLT
jgi:hypothetical protein